MGKKYRGGTDVYGESIYTKRGNYWVLMNFLLQKNVVFIFLYGPRPKLHLYIPHEATLALGN
jgi:hypothetical protein